MFSFLSMSTILFFSRLLPRDSKGCHAIYHIFPLLYQQGKEGRKSVHYIYPFIQGYISEEKILFITLKL